MRSSALALVIAAACGPDAAGESEDGVDDDGDECDACPVNPLIDAAKSESEQTPEDCGYVGQAAETESWTYAHDCALAASQGQTAFVVVWQPQVIDSAHFTALVGAAGESYAITLIDWDCYQGDVMASRRSCESVVPTSNCTVEPGVLCLECVGPQEQTMLCE